MIAPNKVGDTDLASPSIPQRRKPPKLRYKRPPQHSLDEAVEEEPNIDTLNPRKQASISETSEDESTFEDASEEQSSGIEAQLQPVPERQRQTVRNKPFREEEEERDVAEEGDAQRHRPRRGQRGEQQLAQLNTIDSVGRAVGQSGDLVRNTTGRPVGTTADTSGRVLARQSEGNEPLKKKDEQVRLHLELNLDLEVQLKAKISGDLTLTLMQ